jgi:hypothetical protein
MMVLMDVQNDSCVLEPSVLQADTEVNQSIRAIGSEMR